MQLLLCGVFAQSQRQTQQQALPSVSSRAPSTAPQPSARSSASQSIRADPSSTHSVAAQQGGDLLEALSQALGQDPQQGSGTSRHTAGPTGEGADRNRVTADALAAALSAVHRPRGNEPAATREQEESGQNRQDQSEATFTTERTHDAANIVTADGLAAALSVAGQSGEGPLPREGGSEAAPVPGTV